MIKDDGGAADDDGDDQGEDLDGGQDIADMAQ